MMSLSFKKMWDSCETPVRLKFIQLPNTSEVFPFCQICQGTLVWSRHYFPSPWTDAGRRLAPMRRLWTWPDEMDDIWNHPIPWAKRFWRFEDSNGLEVIEACPRISQNHPQDSIVTSPAGLVVPQDPRHQRQSFRWDLREEDREMGHTWIAEPKKWMDEWMVYALKTAKNIACCENKMTDIREPYYFHDISHLGTWCRIQRHRFIPKPLGNRLFLLLQQVCMNKFPDVLSFNSPSTHHRFNRIQKVLVQMSVIEPRWKAESNIVK